MSETDVPSDLAVVIGRFQPFHHGHLALLEHALSLAPRALLVLGSARGPRMAKNPFSFEERKATILASLPTEQRARVSCVGVRDYYDEPRWAAAVKAAVARETTGRVALVGFRKDDSSSYLSLFPEWREVSLPRQAPIDGTALRRSYFASSVTGDALPAELVSAVPAPVADFLIGFRKSAEFAALREELVALDDNALRWGTGPFVTVDAVVTRGEQLLLIQRGRPPGKGQWALPGGFLEGSERLLTGAMRELREETQLACSDDELRQALRGVAVFDHPQRSQRGRTITHAHYFDLPPGASSEVAGADDAEAAHWVPVAGLCDRTHELFEDHFQIIDHFLKISRD
jgi:bifunctional NMN adenylyltransferase/nudix hydrolase